MMMETSPRGFVMHCLRGLPAVGLALCLLVAALRPLHGQSTEEQLVQLEQSLGRLAAGGNPTGCPKPDYEPYIDSITWIRRLGLTICQPRALLLTFWQQTAKGGEIPLGAPRGPCELSTSNTCKCSRIHFKRRLL